MRIIAVIGSRTKNKDDHFRCGRIVGHAFKVLNRSSNIILSGGASSGADWWAKQYCIKYNFRYLEAPAFWENGKQAGLVRNRLIADVCDLALVVWDGKSRGTMSAMADLEACAKEYWTVQL